jgi:serine acetyltransferase
VGTGAVVVRDVADVMTVVEVPAIPIELGNASKSKI